MADLCCHFGAFSRVPVERNAKIKRLAGIELKGERCLCRPLSADVKIWGRVLQPRGDFSSQPASPQSDAADRTGSDSRWQMCSPIRQATE